MTITSWSLGGVVILVGDRMSDQHKKDFYPTYGEFIVGYFSPEPERCT